MLPEDGAWTVRVVPNLYPALERQEVVVHSPRHVRTFAELEDAELDLVAEAWRRRFAAAAEDGFPYVHAMINEGRFAGASLAHSHSQLVWLREPPPAVAREATADCVVCRLVANKRLAVADRGEIAAVCHPAGRAPFELLIGPRAHDPEAEDDFAGALRLLREAIRRLRELEGPVPWNAWLHLGAHWHLEVVPRLTVFAGLDSSAPRSTSTLWRPRARPRRCGKPARGTRRKALRRARAGSARGSDARPRWRRPDSRPLSLACLISITVSTASMS